MQPAPKNDRFRPFPCSSPSFREHVLLLERLLSFPRRCTGPKDLSEHYILLGTPCSACGRSKYCCDPPAHRWQLFPNAVIHVFYLATSRTTLSRSYHFPRSFIKPSNLQPIARKTRNLDDLPKGFSSPNTWDAFKKCTRHSLVCAKSLKQEKAYTALPSIENCQLLQNFEAET